MNAQDAISRDELERTERVPTYYCEECGEPIGYPSETGCCEACDVRREDFDNKGNDPRR